MDSQVFNSKISSSSKPIISLILCFLLVVIGVCPVRSTRPDPGKFNRSSQAFRPGEESEKMKMMRAHLAKLNKPAVKSVQSSDGDIIDCVESDKQPAFDHPMLKGQKPLDPPERPKGRRRHPTMTVYEEDFQVWRSSSSSGESCPEGTIPIRRTLERDVLRAYSLDNFGRKTVRRDSTAGNGAGHEVSARSMVHHAIGYVSGGEAYYGAKGSMSVWAPRVDKPYEFSLSQVWLISGTFGDDLNTIEAGWQVSPDLYGDNYPRFFTYWTSDAYQGTGCYNLLCSGFVQTSNKIAIGAAISPTSSYKAGQYDISILIWKDPKKGDWWLEFGSGTIVGYWPSFLFTHLRTSASMVQFGGEVVNSDSPTAHTSTQMGSGHFAKEGFGRASYFRNLQVVDWDNTLLPLSNNLKLVADKPNCYDIQGGVNRVWGSYFYYGGPGRNSKCP